MGILDLFFHKPPRPPVPVARDIREPPPAPVFRMPSAMELRAGLGAVNPALVAALDVVASSGLARGIGISGLAGLARVASVSAAPVAPSDLGGRRGRLIGTAKAAFRAFRQASRTRAPSRE